MFQRSDGCWAKKNKGKQRIFGRDKAAVSERYKREMGLAAIGLSADADGIGLSELFNRYLAAR